MLDVQPDAERLFQAGRAAWLRNDVDSAIPLLEQAFALDQAAGYGYALGCALLKAGRLDKGFPLLNKWRGTGAGRHTAPRIPIPAWSGQPVAGKHFLIWGEDGLGDQIMYLRFAVDLIHLGARVSWICPPPLTSLIAHMGVTPLPNDQPFTISDADFYAPSSALPQTFGLAVHAIDGRPFIPRPAPVSHGRIAVMTSASPIHRDGSERTLPEDQASRLLSLADAVNLDPPASGACDFLETAAIMAGASLVVTVDTATAHLAGAMGLPTLILLPHVACWRWFTDPSRTPWYDSAELVRQARDGDWSPVVDYALTRARWMSTSPSPPAEPSTDVVVPPPPGAKPPRVADPLAPLPPRYGP